MVYANLFQSLLLPVGKDSNFLKLLSALYSDCERNIRVFKKNEHLLYTNTLLIIQSHAALTLSKMGNP